MPMQMQYAQHSARRANATRTPSSVPADAGRPLRAGRRSATANAMALGLVRPDSLAQAQERQAEQAANQIMAGARATLGDVAPGPCSRGAGATQSLQAKVAAGVAGHGVPNAATVAAGQGSGMALSTNSRALFEPRLGVELGGVRLHTDTRAAQAAASLRAQAFTVGQDIHFGDGQYRPDTQAGQHLLAHDHAVQNRDT